MAEYMTMTACIIQGCKIDIDTQKNISKLFAESVDILNQFINTETFAKIRKRTDLYKEQEPHSPYK